LPNYSTKNFQNSLKTKTLNKRLDKPIVLCHTLRMSGEAHSAFFRRTNKTQEDNWELCEIFERWIINSPVKKHMKFYPTHIGQVELYEKGGENVPKWMEKYLRFDGTFELMISTHESWYEDADIYESFDRADSFVSLAKKFAEQYNLEYYNGGIYELVNELQKKA